MAKSTRFHYEQPAAAVAELFEKTTGRVFIGIDPGITGAIAVLSEDRSVTPVVIDMPITSIKSKSAKTKSGIKVRNEYDNSMFCALLDSAIDARDRVSIALERQQPRFKDTPLTAFSLGEGYGGLKMFMAAFAIPCEVFLPKAWKSKMGLTDDKSQSIVTVGRLFPAARYLFAAASDHNRAEALLLAEYLRRCHNITNKKD